jgi:hypothetical protein
MAIPGNNQGNKTARIKIPQIARWRIAGISDGKIAQLIGMSPSGLAGLLASREYLDYENSYLEGHLSEMDRNLAGKRDVLRQGLREAVPAALRCLVDTVTQRRDMKAAFAAAREILDRDPDRTLQAQPEAQQSTTPEEVPEAVMEAAVKAGNVVAENYNKDPQKAKVN